MQLEVLRTVASCGLLLAATLIAIGPELARAVPSGRSPATQSTQADRAIFERVLRAVRDSRAETPGGRLTAAGLTLAGTPYLAGGLEIPGPERLVCNLRGLDCVTFVEACLAVSRVAVSGKADFDSFLAELARQRYREGRPDGYASRLHYFAEWIRHNAARGVLRDITADLGGRPEPRPLRYMTANRRLYPRLKDEAVFAQMARIEARLEQTPMTVILRDQVAAAAEGLQDGDILAFVPTTEGLDVSHTGLAHRGDDGAIRLLHAPDVGQVVRVNPETLPEYFASQRKLHGLVVARPI